MFPFALSASTLHGLIHALTPSNGSRRFQTFFCILTYAPVYSPFHLAHLRPLFSSAQRPCPEKPRFSRFPNRYSLSFRNKPHMSLPNRPPVLSTPFVLSHCPDRQTPDSRHSLSRIHPLSCRYREVSPRHRLLGDMPTTGAADGRPLGTRVSLLRIGPISGTPSPAGNNVLPSPRFLHPGCMKSTGIFQSGRPHGPSPKA